MPCDTWLDRRWRGTKRTEVRGFLCDAPPYRTEAPGFNCADLAHRAAVQGFALRAGTLVWTTVVDAPVLPSASGRVSTSTRRGLRARLPRPREFPDYDVAEGNDRA